MKKDRNFHATRPLPSTAKQNPDDRYCMQILSLQIEKNKRMSTHIHLLTSPNQVKYRKTHE